MLSHKEARVLSRLGARELSMEEVANVTGGACTERATFLHGAQVDVLIDDCT